MMDFGEYILESRLGKGGQGEVFKVRDPRIPGKFWALKVFGEYRSFERERQALASLDQLHHPAVPRLANIVSLNGKHGLVMTYFPGNTLESSKPGWRRAVAILCEMAGLLERAHGAGWLYLDLKPANLIQASDGQIRLVDYGLAQPINTAVSEGEGSPGFAPPEQITTGNRLNPAADAYALGALGYYLLTGSPPDPVSPPRLEDAPSSLEVVLRHLVQPLPHARLPLSRVVTLSVQALEQSLVKCKSCSLEVRSERTQCPRCQVRLHPATPISPGLPRHQRVLPATVIHPPGGNTSLVLSELHKPSRLRDVALRDLRLEVEKVARVRGFEELQAPNRLRHLITFYPHQLDTARRALQEMRGNAILADEVGLGKTIEAGLIIHELNLRQLVKRVLILVPSHLVDQWAAEMNEKFNLHFVAYENPSDWGKPLLVSSINTLQAGGAAKLTNKEPYDLIVVDEMHNLLKKNGEPKKVYEAVARLPRNYILLLSATPIRRKLDELYHLINLIRPGYFRSLQEFQTRFTRWDNQRVNTGELRAALQEVMIRHNRGNLPQEDLPPPRQVEARELIQSPDEQRLQEAVLHAIQRRIMPANPNTLSQAFSSPATQIQLLSRHGLPVSGSPTSNKLAELVQIVQQANSQCIVFTREVATANWLYQNLQQRGFDAVLFGPGLTRAQKAERFWQFKRKPRGVLVATDTAAEGRNLQFAHHLINFDIPWNPLRLEQRIGRVDRLGQKNPPIIYNLFCANTFEGTVYSLFNQGLRMFDLIIGELASVLEELEEFGDQPLDHMIADIWQRHAGQPIELIRAMSDLSAKLRTARHEFDKEKQFQDSTDRELF